MTKIIYFDADFDCDVCPLDLTDEEVKEYIKKGTDSIHIYNTMEDYCEAFNNEYISDLGWLRLLDFD